jgi:hypothetical protein
MLGLLAALPTILPVAFEAVKLAEKIFGRGKGSSKKSLAVDVVKMVLKSYEGIKGEDIVDEDALSEGVGNIVDGIVKVLNATGKFGKDN